MAARFALIADAAMATLGGTLKRAENISGRLADALAWMYIASATVNRYVADPEDEVLFDWATREALWQANAALYGVIANLPNRVVARLLKFCVFPLGVRARPPDDRLTNAAAHKLLDDTATRQRLTANMFVPSPRELGLGRLELALELAVATRALRARLRDAVRSGLLSEGPDVLDQAVAKHVLGLQECRQLQDAEAARDDAIQVDAFSPAAFARPEPPFAPPPQISPAPGRELPH